MVSNQIINHLFFVPKPQLSVIKIKSKSVSIKKVICLL